MAKIRKKKIHWTASTDPDVVGYKLYWTRLGTGVIYSPPFSHVGNVTGVILPDDVPSFPLTAGEFGFRVTAVNHLGNESEIGVLAAHIDFLPPLPPRNLVTDDT